MGRQGAALHLVPPGALLGQARAVIVVSPLVPVSDRMPPPEDVIAQALGAELARGARVVTDGPALPARAASGLEGVRREVVVEIPGGAVQHRAYVMYRDERFLYGIHYLADPGTWAHFLPAFDAAADAVLPG